MCGIACIIGSSSERDMTQHRDRMLDMARLLRHRGPDCSGIFVDRGAVLAHERLAIIGVNSGAQPLSDQSGSVALAVNGEIYNHAEIRRATAHYPYKTASDCEVILPLYESHGWRCVSKLSGIFAFVLYDAKNGRHLLARDPIGVNPLYTGRDADGNLYAASELKALVPYCRTIQDFPPGHYLTDGMDEPAPYYQPAWQTYSAVKDAPLDLGILRSALQSAVSRQMMSDVPFGLLLSGGLDSSVIARCARQRSTEADADSATAAALHSFSIGLVGSPDLAAAKHVSEALKTTHHELTFTAQQGLDALRDVIHHIESYDVTTVRASVPMYLMARRIRSLGIKMVLSGEGADEVFGGYLYFHKAPNDREFHEETVRKLALLHKYDCLRANKAMAAWGVEVRVPFLDRDFLDVAMAFAPAAKMVGPGRIEKYPLRKAFEGDLPAEILWRQKEQFSDGVGYGWIASLKAHAERVVTGPQLSAARYRFRENPPATKEAYLYREIFESLFGSEAASCVAGGPSIACSTPAALEWHPTFASNADPSGRSVTDVHVAPATGSPS